MDDPGDQSNEEAPKAIKPTSKEFRKTWGFRRTTIAKREGAGDTEADPAEQQPHILSLRRSGRQPKRTERVEEFLTTVRRRGRKNVPICLEDPGEAASCPVTDAESASEGSVESSSETKSVPVPASKLGKERPASSKKAKGGDEQGDTSDSDSDGLTLKELQNRLRRKREQEPVERPLKGILNRLRKKRREEDPGDTAEGEVAGSGHDVPPCKQESEAGEGPVNQAAEDDRESDSEETLAQGPREEGPGDGGKPKPDSEVYDPSALYCICRQPHNNRWVRVMGGKELLTSERSQA